MLESTKKELKTTEKPWKKYFANLLTCDGFIVWKAQELKSQ